MSTSQRSILTLLCIFFSLTAVFAQGGSAQLNTNDVRARINSGGDLFWDFANSQYEVPLGGGVYSIFAGNLWIGGMDTAGLLHLAAQTYRQVGTDFFQGPMMKPGAYSAVTDSKWSQVWLVTQREISNFIGSGFTSIPPDIANWPGNGDTTLGQMHQMAPFVDANGDGIYTPSAGDYPDIQGDQAIFFVYNDDRNTHTESQGAKLGVEIHGLAYAYSSSASYINNTVFTKYKIFNRSKNTYHKLIIANWTDTDIGKYDDDYVGCDVARSAFYGYNGATCDGTGVSGQYGCHPPAQATVMLQGPLADANDGIDNNHNGVTDEPGERWTMATCLYYDNSTDVMKGNPSGAANYYNYMQSVWRTGVPLSYDGKGGTTGSTPCDYMFPGSSDSSGWGTAHTHQAAWSEVTANNTPGDRRGLGAFGGITFKPGDAVCLDFAYVWARTATGNNFASLNDMQTAIDSVRSIFVRQNMGRCMPADLSTGIAEIPATPAFSLYPNPATEILNLSFGTEVQKGMVEICDISGRVILSLNLHASAVQVSVQPLAKGIYFVRFSDGKNNSVRKFVKE
ncbi:MAG TPA: T9SS type A sorting domain-containing protein [Bacteroidia bacterium]|jgi:hypothetical protein|nr:T9SS type A sorting domain-containing protein [Bacteroidia bacterium]